VARNTTHHPLLARPTEADHVRIKFALLFASQQAAPSMRLYSANESL